MFLLPLVASTAALAAGAAFATTTAAAAAELPDNTADHPYVQDAPPLEAEGVLSRIWDDVSDRSQETAFAAGAGVAVPFALAGLAVLVALKAWKEL